MASTTMLTTDSGKTKKEKKAKNVKARPTEAEDASATGAQPTPTITSSPETSSLKRKRDTAPVDELEIDVSLPEPPSKKALRKAKKTKTDPQTAPATSSPPPQTASTTATEPSAKRSAHAIWIGNLPFTATKASLREFLTNNAEITDAQITRVYMPAPAADSKQKIKPQNKGFAYVDFADAAALGAALGLSEKLVGGRRVLIKDAKSFEGRPEKAAVSSDSASAPGGASGGSGKVKPPNKRVFVGNLGFDVTKEELAEHFRPCGEIADIFMATFEDTGKCKGFAWVTFTEIGAGEAAVRGWVALPLEQSESEDDDMYEQGGEDGKAKEKKDKKKKTRKWFVNRLRGRALRCEFAEDAATRYKKRFGKEGTKKGPDGAADHADDVAGDGEEGAAEIPNSERSHGMVTRALDKPRRKVDARKIRPGAALASAHRSTAAIVKGQGKKTTFE